MADEVAKEILGFDPDDDSLSFNKQASRTSEILLTSEIKEKFNKFVISGGAGVEIDETTKIVEDNLFVLGNSRELKLFDSEVERIYYRYDPNDKREQFKQLATIHFTREEDAIWKIETIWLWNEKGISLHFYTDNISGEIEVVADSNDFEESFKYNSDGSLKEYVSQENRFSSRSLKDVPRISGKLIEMPSKVNMQKISNLVNNSLLDDPTNPDINLDNSWKLGTIEAFGVEFK